MPSFIVKSLLIPSKHKILNYINPNTRINLLVSIYNSYVAV